MVTMIARVSLGRPETYPWKKWTDGKARRATKGKDFKCSVEGFASTIRSYARRHNLQATVSLKPNAVEFEFSSR